MLSNCFPEPGAPAAAAFELVRLCSAPGSRPALRAASFDTTSSGFPRSARSCPQPVSEPFWPG